MSTKGQIFSFDFLLAVALFLISITALLSYWSYSSKQLEGSRKIAELTDKAILLSDVWFREGIPSGWDVDSVVDLGLQSGNRFNQTKLDYLDGIGYDNVKKMASVRGYEFYMRVYDSGNNTLFFFGNSSLDGENIAKVKRIGVLDGSVVFVDSFLWK